MTIARMAKVGGMPYSKLVEESVMGEDVGLSERDRSVPTQGDVNRQRGADNVRLVVQRNQKLLPGETTFKTRDAALIWLTADSGDA